MGSGGGRSSGGERDTVAIDGHGHNLRRGKGFRWGIPVEGKEPARTYLASILGGQRMNITIETVRWIAEEELLIAEYSSKGEFLDNGDPYQNNYVGYWFFEGDRICRTREYYNPQAPRASAIG